MANVGVDALLQLVAQGNTDLKAVVSPNKSLPYIIAGKAELKTPADLAGHSFGIGRPGSLDHSLSQLVLKQAGIDLSSLNFVALGQPNVRAQALAAGQVDATTISIGVWLSIPDKTGLGIIVDQPTYYAAAPTVNKVNIVSAKTLSERHDEVLGVIRALIKISRDYAANPQAWADNLAPLLPNVQKATLDELAKTFTGSWSVNGGLSATELQFTQDYLYGTEDFKDAKPVTLADWVDFGPVDEVLKDLGTDQSGDTPAR
jgi:NitT/TauT family transport system substrate-binding protein